MKAYLHIMKAVLLLSLVILGCASVAQNSGDIIRIKFSSLTRGYQELVSITSDSIKISHSQAGAEKIEKVRALKKDEWTEVVKSLQKVTLSEINALESPTNKRTYDGARHSTFTITTKSNQVFTHSFDNEEPHQKLVPLMNIIQNIK